MSGRGRHVVVLKNMSICKVPARLGAVDLLRNVLKAYGPYNPRIMRTDFHSAAAVRCVPSRNRMMGFHFVLRGTAYVTGGPITDAICLQENDLLFFVRAFTNDVACRPGVPPAVISVHQVTTVGDPDDHAALQVISGGFALREHPRHRLFEELPDYFVLPSSVVHGDRRLFFTTQLISAELQHQHSIPDTDTRSLLVELVVHYSLGAWLQSHRAVHADEFLNDQFVHRLLQVLHGEASVHWTIEALAREVGLSRQALSDHFKKVFNETPSQYLVRVRIAKAKELLKHTDRSLEEIAGEVGYADAFALSKAFKRHEGLSPTQYRSAVREGNVARPVASATSYAEPWVRHPVVEARE